ncbi:hypothetical protein ACQU0X_28230 [Pseudovibrio ascidiaceicola]|uniref:hypothetical protein n=1 Tax=Pseudovibrio ascidiaceicola TaxID=285279 RepID=UPI003D364E53
MTLPNSGKIYLSQVRTELGASGKISLGSSAVRNLAGVSSGKISMSDLRGKSSISLGDLLYSGQLVAEYYENPLFSPAQITIGAGRDMLYSYDYYGSFDPLPSVFSYLNFSMAYVVGGSVYAGKTVISFREKMSKLNAEKYVENGLVLEVDGQKYAPSQALFESVAGDYGNATILYEMPQIPFVDGTTHSIKIYKHDEAL